MAKKLKFTPDEIINALKQAKGYVSKTASILRCTCPTVYNYAKTFPEVKAAWDDIREERHDFVENALHNLIKEGNITAIIFYLKTQAKQRGYSERHEFVHTHTWRDDIMPLVKNGELKYETAVSELGESLAQEIFNEAGVEIK